MVVGVCSRCYRTLRPLAPLRTPAYAHYRTPRTTLPPRIITPARSPTPTHLRHAHATARRAHTPHHYTHTTTETTLPRPTHTPTLLHFTHCAHRWRTRAWLVNKTGATPLLLKTCFARLVKSYAWRALALDYRAINAYYLLLSPTACCGSAAAAMNVAAAGAGGGGG